MVFIIFAVLLLFVSWRWGNWQKWREYQATMLYMSLMNFSYYYYTNHAELWKFHSEFSHVINETIQNFIINPIMVFLFLCNYPENTKKYRQFFYTIVFIVAFSLLEGIAYWFGFISFDKGWSFWWSVLLYTLMFPMFRLHYKKPIWAYLFSFVFLLLFLKIFDFLG